MIAAALVLVGAGSVVLPLNLGDDEGVAYNSAQTDSATKSEVSAMRAGHAFTVERSVDLNFTTPCCEGFNPDPAVRGQILGRSAGTRPRSQSASRPGAKENLDWSDWPGNTARGCPSVHLSLQAPSGLSCLHVSGGDRYPATRGVPHALERVGPGAPGVGSSRSTAPRYGARRESSAMGPALSSKSA